MEWRSLFAAAVLAGIGLELGSGALSQQPSSERPSLAQALPIGPVDAEELLLGDLLFHSTHVLGSRAQSLKLSCNSCHPKGLTDRSFFIEGLSDRRGNVDLKTAFFHGGSTEGSTGPVNIPSLRGVRHTAPYGRDGRTALLRVFIENVVTSEFGGKPLSLPRLRALTTYVQSLDFLPNQLVDRRGHLSERAPAAARRGEAIFRTPLAGLDNHSCADCHVPAQFFTDGKVHPRPDTISGPAAGANVFKTPTLLNIVETAPYFHDGRFDNIEDVIAWYNRHYRLGLAPEAEADLSQYVTAVGSVDTPVKVEDPRDQLIHAARYLALLETGESPNDREIWSWTLELVSDEVGSPAASNDVRARLDAAGQNAAAISLNLKKGDALDQLRPSITALRRVLMSIAVDWSLEAERQPDGQRR